jgi:hypothetical protein
MRSFSHSRQYQNPRQPLSAPAYRPPPPSTPAGAFSSRRAPNFLRRPRCLVTIVRPAAAHNLLLQRLSRSSALIVFVINGLLTTLAGDYCDVFLTHDSAAVRKQVPSRLQNETKNDFKLISRPLNATSNHRRKPHKHAPPPPPPAALHRSAPPRQCARLLPKNSAGNGLHPSTPPPPPLLPPSSLSPQRSPCSSAPAWPTASCSTKAAAAAAAAAAA